MWQIGGFLTFGIACVQLTMAEVLGCKEGCCPPGPHSEAGKDSFGNSSANLLPHFDGPNSYETLLFAPRYWILRWSFFWITRLTHQQTGYIMKATLKFLKGFWDLLEAGRDVKTSSKWWILEVGGKYYMIFSDADGQPHSDNVVTCSVTFSCTTGALECGRV